MPFYTPLRYPGGKRRLIGAIIQILEENALVDVEYVEPYAGGAAIGLGLLFEERASVIHINDLSRPVFAFWHSVLNDSESLCQRIERVAVTMPEWHRQREIYDARDTADLTDLGFAALFLNRTNRSGIIGGGVIGGKQQTGSWALDARFNKEELIRRIKRIARYKNRIRLHCEDALEFSKKTVAALGANAFVFYDPPYIENGKDLYLNAYALEDHKELEAVVSSLGQRWVLTYDSAALRHELYPSFQSIVYGLSYSAQSRYEGREVMFLSRGLKLPQAWSVSSPFQMSPDKSRFPLAGMLGREAE